MLSVWKPDEKLFTILLLSNGPAKKQAEKQYPAAINSVSYFSGANFSNQIKSECSDWSMQRKARNLNFRVELR